jgi:hypothetical protein
VVFLRHCVAGLPVNVQAIDYGVAEGAAERLARHLRCEPADIHRMTHAGIGNCVTHLISRKPIQTCEACWSENRLRDQPDAATRGSRRAWRITCSICEARLSPASEVLSNEPTQNIVALLDSIWDEALQGERLLESYLTSEDKTAAAAVAALRMLLVPRNGPFGCEDPNVPRPRAIDILVLGFTGIIARGGLARTWEKHLIVPLQARPALLAGFRRLIEKPRPKFWVLWSAMVGAYRLRLETLGAEATPILGRVTMS